MDRDNLRVRPPRRAVHLPGGSALPPHEQALHVDDGAQGDQELAVVGLRDGAALVPNQDRRRRLEVVAVELVQAEAGGRDAVPDAADAAPTPGAHELVFAFKNGKVAQSQPIGQIADSCTLVRTDVNAPVEQLRPRLEEPLLPVLELQVSEEGGHVGAVVAVGSGACAVLARRVERRRRPGRLFGWNLIQTRGNSSIDRRRRLWLNT